MIRTGFHRISNKQTELAVAQVNYRFFERSETFIYFYLSHFRRINPICLSWSSPIINSDIFPFPARDSYSYARKEIERYTPRWLWHGIRRRSMFLLQPDLRERSINRFIWAKSILRQRKARLIHAHFGPTGWQVLPLKRSLRLPLITTFYGYDVAPEIRPDWPRQRQQLFDEGDLFLVEGPFMRQRLIDLGCPPEKVKIQRIAIDIEKVPFCPRKPKANGKIIIMFAGRFCEKKGLMHSLQAVQELWKGKHNVEFRIIGDGELAPQVRAFIRENNLEDCVKLLGFLNHQDYLREMQQADIFLHPSVVANNGDSEGGAPTVILEAQGLGVPVVSTFHADIPNVTLPGESALLVPERDPEAIINALLFLLKNPERWEEMGRTGHSYVEKYHNINREVLSLEDKYFKTLDGTIQSSKTDDRL